MRVLTYVDGVLTVIREDMIHAALAEKPDFITGESFYFEPTLTSMDGVSLNGDLIELAEEYINDFEFPVGELEPGVVIKHYVMENGPYIGVVKTSESDIEVDGPPPSIMTYPYWNGVEYVDGVLVNKDTNILHGYGDIRSTTESVFYAPASKLVEGANGTSQVWDPVNEMFKLSLSAEKDLKIAELQRHYRLGIAPIYESYKLVDLEDVTFPTQKAEAEAYDLDNTAPTPLLDKILEGRGIDGETMDSLVQKVLNHSSNFNNLGLLIGRYQGKLKKVEAATNAKDVRLVTWL